MFIKSIIPQQHLTLSYHDKQRHFKNRQEKDEGGKQSSNQENNDKSPQLLGGTIRILATAEAFA